MASDNRHAAPRRYLLVLLKREKHVAERVGRASRGGKVPLHLPHVRRLVAESGALAWAIGELERLHPMAAATARQELQISEALEVLKENSDGE